MTDDILREKRKPDDGHIFKALKCKADEKITSFKVILWSKTSIWNMFSI